MLSYRRSIRQGTDFMSNNQVSAAARQSPASLTTLKFSWTKCLKNQPRDVIKMREMREEVVKKTLKKNLDNSSFL